MGVRVWGGMTGAGGKSAPRAAQTAPWTCTHGHENKPAHRNCMTSGCRDRRPDCVRRPVE